jgi:transcriptional regulator with XRE-family HTH domain
MLDMPIYANSEYMIKRREELELNQRDIAWRVSLFGMKLSNTQYSRIERNVEGYTNIQVETAFAIARALECNIEDIFRIEFENDIKDFPPAPSQKRKMKSGTRNSVKQTIGKQLRKIREDLKLPAREAGKGIGVNPSYIYLIEKGDGSMETMDKLARFYGYDLKDITPTSS